MARSVLLPVTVALVVSLTVVILAGPTRITAPEPSSRTPEERGETPRAARPPGPAPLPLDRSVPPDFEKRLGTLEKRIDELQARLDSMSTDVGRIEAEVTGPDPEQLDDAKLLAHASSLSALRDYEDALRYWLELLERDLEPDQRAQALQSVGFSYRMTGRHEQSETYFRELLAHHGENTPQGMFALYHVAWSRSNLDDLQGARDIMLRVSRTPHTEDIWKKWSRANAADFTIRLGEAARARTMLESLKADLAEDDSANGLRIRGYVDRMLADLDG
jgi:pentatricopeptide repeat protein